MGFHVFGLTGGIGSGKSTVAEQLRRRGVPVVDADELARRVVEPGTPALAEIVKAFGVAVQRASGELDRAKLASAVFSDGDALERLNAIVHPRVAELAQRELQQLAARGFELAAYDVPLLFETDRAAALKPVVVVSVTPEQQIERVVQRDGHSREQVVARIAAQWPLARKVALADYVVDNSGSREATLVQADAILRQLCERFDLAPKRYGL